jgi:predicted glycosyltransferase
MTPRALIYVQHLLGIGHLARAHRIASAMVEAGIATTIAQGGAGAGLAAAPGVETIQLTPAKVTADDMSTLLHADGRPFTDLDKQRRCEALLHVLRRVRPDILVIEAFPFGRRPMRFELIPLLEAAKAMGVPVIASSIRDILQQNAKLGRAEETADLVNTLFDLVLVHGDEAMTPLAMTFPQAHAIAAKTRYTGLVAPKRPAAIVGGYAVIVSAGGGSVGAALLEAAVAAAPLTSFRDEAWLVLAGPNLPEADFARLRAMASGKVAVARSVPDLAAHLAGAKVSVSQAGYNTVADVLVAGSAAVLTPFAAGGETEQTVRAEALAAAGRAVVVREKNLSPLELAAAIDRAAALPKSAAQVLAGGARTAAILLDALAGKTIANKRVETASPLASSPARVSP